FQDAPYFKVSRFFRVGHALEKAQVYEAFDGRVYSTLQSAFVCACRQERDEQFAHLVVGDRAFPGIEMGRLELVEPLTQEYTEQRHRIGQAVAPCQPGQCYRLPLVVFKGGLVQISVAILFVNAHFKTNAREILLNRREIGEQQVPGSCLVVEEWILK